MQSQAARELTPAEVAAGEQHIMTTELKATEVQALVRNMDHSKKKWRHLRREEFMQKMQEENTVLYYNYPSLWTMHAEDRLDTTFFEMLAMKRKVEKGEMTPEQASVEVGKKLYAKFIPQVTENAPPVPTMSYEDYYKQFAGPTGGTRS
jgi:cellobiose-specific phosphotransferase system component IIA